MWGGRELALGEWLWTADYEDSERKELKRAMRLNALVDAVDLGSVGYAVSLIFPLNSSVVDLDLLMGISLRGGRWGNCQVDC